MDANEAIESPVLEPEESPYLRRQKQVEVRRSRIRVRNVGRLRVLILSSLVAVLLALGVYRAVGFALHDPLFRLSEDNIRVNGLKYVGRHRVAEKFAGDVGRSLFTIPLTRRRAMIEEISWVESAAVSRAWPDQLLISVQERVPVAFVRTPSGLYLADRHGVIMERPPRATFTFPVIAGLGERDTPEKRQERMNLYVALLADLDSDGSHQSLDISEVDVSDSEDARVVVAAHTGGDSVLLHLGNSNFLSRYRTYLAHIRGWRQQFEKIQSVDLRYERQIIVNPDHR